MVKSQEKESDKQFSEVLNEAEISKTDKESDKKFSELFDEIDSPSEEKNEDDIKNSSDLMSDMTEFSEFIDEITDKSKDLGEEKDSSDLSHSSEPLIQIQEDEENEEDEEKDNSEENKIEDTKRKLKIVDGKIEWMLESPSGLYDSFYEKKKELVDILPGEYLPFDKWAKELIECHTDITSEVFDNIKYVKQMDEIQNMRERVKDIQIKCNNQHFILKRFILLLRGCLAQVQYLKPQIKQEGLIHEHMRDIELYFARAEDLFDSAQKVSETLKAAYDTLSRKATITTPLRSGDRYGNTGGSIGDSHSQVDRDDFDKLPEKKDDSKESSGEVEEVEWGNI